jgi:hypothetical protein
VTVTTFGGLVVPTKSALKLREVAEKTVVSIPVPDKGTTSGLPNDEFMTVNTPVLGPAAVGVNVICKVHDEFGKRVVQLPDFANSPLVTMLLIVTLRVPVLRRVRTLEGLVMVSA